MEKKVNILGSEWTIKWVEDRELLDDFDYDGFTDKSIRTIVINRIECHSKDSIRDYNVYFNSVLRHEIIHAFLFESGIGSCYHVNLWGHDEFMVDWMASQFPKIQKVYKELNICD